MTFTDLLNELGVSPDTVLSDEQQEKANTAAEDDVGTVGEQEPIPPPTTFDLPPFDQDQFDLLTDTDLTQGNPETRERDSAFGIELEAENGDSEPLNAAGVTVDVNVTDHLNTDPFGDAPNDGLSGETTVEFEEGEGSFTIGGDNRDDADFTLGFFGFLPEVNDVETIEVDAPDGIEIVNRTLELNPDISNPAIITAGTSDSSTPATITADTTDSSEDGFTETIEERE